MCTYANIPYCCYVFIHTSIYIYIDINIYVHIHLDECAGIEACGYLHPQETASVHHRAYVCMYTCLHGCIESTSNCYT